MAKTVKLKLGFHELIWENRSQQGAQENKILYERKMTQDMGDSNDSRWHPLKKNKGMTMDAILVQIFQFGLKLHLLTDWQTVIAVSGAVLLT